MSAGFDGRKARREYLERVVRIYARAAGGSALCVGLAGAITIAGLCLLYWMGIDFGQRQANEPILPVALFFLIVFVTACVLGHRMETMMEKAQEAAAREYVPPVHTATLPAEEVLLRGSERPVLPESDSLLRAAHSSQAAAAHELLRPETESLPEPHPQAVVEGEL